MFANKINKSIMHDLGPRNTNRQRNKVVHHTIYNNDTRLNML